MSSDLSQLIADAKAGDQAPAPTTLAELWQRIMPWEDLQAKSPAERYLQLGRDVMAVLAALTAQGPDRPRLLKTDALSRLLTATTENPSLLLIAPVTGPQALIFTNAQYIAPPGTTLLLLNQAGQSEIVTVSSWTGSTQLNLDRGLQYTYAIGDSATVIPDIELRSVPRFVGSMTVSPISTQSMQVQLPAGTKCVYVTGRSGTKSGVPGTVTVSGVQTGVTYYSGTGMPGPRNPLLIDAIDDSQINVQAQNTGSAQAGMAVFCYASLSNDVVQVTTAPGQSVAVAPAAGFVFPVQLSPGRQVKSVVVNNVVAANTDVTLIGGVAGQTIEVLRVMLAPDAAVAGGVLVIKDGAGGTQIGGVPFSAVPPVPQDWSGPSGGRLLTAGNGFVINAGGNAGNWRGTVLFTQQ